MVDSKSREFKLISGKDLFRDMIMNIRAVILASGTPCTAMIADEYCKIEAPHPVDIERRRVYYYPVGKMTYQERTKTIDFMAEKIAALHKRYNRNTLVHCHSFAIAELLGHAVYDYDVRCGWVEKGQREDNIARWMDSDNVCLMSVACEEGLDLPGEKYPLNIIAKVPFVPYKSDEWTDRRKEADNKLPSEQRYENVSTAIAIQQAAGRCTRGPDDFSETWILDASFEWFYKRHYRLFEDWFKDALVRVE
jgi:Rad3-related DNA helicase